MENTSDSFIPRPLLFCLESERSVCYSVPDNNKMAILLSEDCSEIVLFLEGKEMINVGKNGRTKNYDLQKRIKTQKKNLPAHYIGKWDEEEKLWYGKYSPYNPNKGEKHLKK